VHFADLFRQTDIDGALAASVFHSGKIPILTLKAYLKSESIEVRV
jgi:cyclase